MVTSIIEKGKPKEKKVRYPYIGVSNGSALVYVLFYFHRKGVVIHSTDNTHYSIGEHSSDWMEEDFEEYFGEIKLTNK